MTGIFGRASLLAMTAAALMLGGCASVEEVHHAQATADEALAAAHHAQETADQALSVAQQAQHDVADIRTHIEEWRTMHHGQRG